MIDYILNNYNIIYKIEIPFSIKPKTNRYLHKNNKRFIPNDVRKNIEKVINYLKNNKYIDTITYKCNIYCEFYFKDNRKRDLDNLSKSLLDCLQKSGIIKDDNLIEMIILKKQTKMSVDKILLIIFI